MAGDVLITQHAAERFIERHAPFMTVAEAKDYLEEAAESAVRLKEKTILGQAQWQIEEPRCVLVVKHDRRVGPVCVTVLPSPEPFLGMTDGELEILREWAERVPTAPPKPALSVEAYAKRVVQPKTPQMAITARAGHGMTFQREQWAIARKNWEEKTKRHDAAQMAHIGRLRVALRVAARVLVRSAAAGDAEALAALETIQAEEPGFVTIGFLVGKPPKAAE